MKTIKSLIIFLAVLLGLFMLIGMYYGVLFFWFVLKLLLCAAAIVVLIVSYGKFKGKG